MTDFVNENTHGIRVLGHRIGAGVVLSASGDLAEALEGTPGVRRAKKGERKAFEESNPGAYKPPPAPPSGLVTASQVDPLSALVAVRKQGMVRDGVETAVLASVPPVGGGEPPAHPDPVIAQGFQAPVAAAETAEEAKEGAEPDSEEEARRIAELTALYEREPWRAEDLDAHTIAELQQYATDHEIVVPSDVTRRDDIQAYIETKRNEA